MLYMQINILALQDRTKLTYEGLSVNPAIPHKYMQIPTKSVFSFGLNVSSISGRTRVL